jgi:hypothetical protein
MELFDNLALGFGVAFTFQNLIYAFIGCLLGTLIGVLPGVGPVATIAMLLPATYALPPVAALIMLAGIYYGAQYGGSTTAILVNLPGEASSVVTMIDGYQMARKGRLRWHLDLGRFCCAADRSGIQVWSCRILLAHGVGPDWRCGAGFRLPHQGSGHDRFGPVDGLDRYRREFGCCSFQL